MGPWPLARFGAAAQLIGRPEALVHPLIAALGPELLHETRVVLGTDLESIGIATQIAPGGDALERAAIAIELASGPDARTFIAGRASSPNAVTLTAIMHRSHAAYRVEHRLPGELSRVAAARGIGGSVVRDVQARLGPLADHVDHVIEHWATTGARGARIGALTKDPTVVSDILARSQIPRAQQTYFADTFPVWTKASPSITVRVAVDASGVVDEVGLGFRGVPGEHLVRAWRTFQPRAELAQQIGSFVGAMGIETASLFELRLQRAGEPLLEATFAPADTEFSR